MYTSWNENGCKGTTEIYKPTAYLEVASVVKERLFEQSDFDLGSRYYQYPLLPSFLSIWKASLPGSPLNNRGHLASIEWAEVMCITSWLRQLENSPLACSSHDKVANNILDGGIPTIWVLEYLSGAEHLFINLQQPWCEQQIIF